MEKVLIAIILLQSIILLAVLAPVVAISAIIVFGILFFLVRIIKKRLE